jgi:uncharacterized membrane protein YhaH (DUF805 family)
MEFLFSFEGRINRARYWSFIGVAVLLGLPGLSFVAKLPDAFRDPHDPTAEALAGLLTLAVSLPLIVAGFAFGVRRWHDRNRSGWWILIGLVPLIGPIWTFVECGCLKGTTGENRFGPDPLSPGVETVFE